MNDAPPVLLAVDGGGTNTDVAVIGLDGELVACGRGPHVSPQVLGVAASLDAIFELAAAVYAQARAHTGGLRALAGAVFHLSGIDLPVERATYLAAARERATAPVIVDNDSFAVLHAGLPSGWGAAVTCGTGANVVVARSDGKQLRYRALGDISGDDAGGYLLGRKALFNAVRSEDGRGPTTDLERRVSEHFDRATPSAVADALHLGDLPFAALSRLVPLVMAAARDGDAVAGRLLDDLGDELALMVTALARRMELDRSDAELPVVLGGGILQAGEDRLIMRFTRVLRRSLPGARVRVLDRPPVAGSARAALRLVDAPQAAMAALDQADWRQLTVAGGHEQPPPGRSQR